MLRYITRVKFVFMPTLKPAFHSAEFCARGVIFRQNCAATKLKTVQLFQSHGKCRSARKIPPSGKQP